jgi:hypothetical protein
MDEGAFEKMAEQNLARQKEIDRREKSSELKELRNSNRINVVLMLLLVVVFGAVALWPVTYGNISANPHQDTAETLIIERSDPENPKAWSVGDLELMESKIWDGKGAFSGSFQYDLNIPGLPIAISGVTTIPVTVEVVSYRTDGGDTGFRIGFFEGNCLDSQGIAIADLPDNLQYNSVESMKIGEPVEVDFNVPAGRYCIVFEYLDPPVEQGFKSTIDAEITSHFLQPLAAPIAGIFVLMSIFALVGAHKSGKAWKKVAQPERPDRKTVEDEVIEEVEEQRGGEGEVAPDEEQDPDAAFPPQAVDFDDTAAETTLAPAEDVATESESSEGEYSDDELRALGWTDQQIEWHRQAENQQQQESEEYTDEQLAGFGWTPEQITAYRNQ